MTSRADRKIADLSHVEKDNQGLFATRIREKAYRARRRARWTWYDQRFSDLMKVIHLRCGRKIPDGLDDADTLIRAMAYHFQARPDTEELSERLTAWCMKHCRNWTTGWPHKGDFLHWIMRDVAGRRRDLGAIALGKELRVTWAERCKLGLRTIMCFDLSPAEFRAARDGRKLQQDRERQKGKRRTAGAVPRAEYEATSATRLKPWEALGISRTRYYDDGHHKSWTSPSQLGEASNVRDGLVQPSRRVATPMVSKSSSGGRCARPARLPPGGNATGTGTGTQEAEVPRRALRPLGISIQQSSQGRPASRA